MSWRGDERGALSAVACSQKAEIISSSNHVAVLGQASRRDKRWQPRRVARRLERPACLLRWDAFDGMPVGAPAAHGPPTGGLARRQPHRGGTLFFFDAETAPNYNAAAIGRLARPSRAFPCVFVLLSALLSASPPKFVSGSSVEHIHPCT